MTKYYQVY